MAGPRKSGTRIRPAFYKYVRVPRRGCVIFVKVFVLVVVAYGSVNFFFRSPCLGIGLNSIVDISSGTLF